MMTHKILALFLILSSYISFSTSSCEDLPIDFWRELQMPNLYRPFTIYCSNITLNNELELNDKFFSSYIVNPSIRALYIVQSKISKVYYKTLNEFRHFEQVTLSNSSLRQIENNTFLNWYLLKRLDLSYNELTAIDFYLPPTITSLYITHNKISHLNEFQKYSKNNETIFIKNLDLSYNKISTFDCINVTESINLSHNKFTEICNFSRTIKKIDFSNNKITHIYEHTFKNLDKLEYLNLNFNYIETIYPGAFHDLINLEFLDLSDNFISELPMGLFYHSENLKTLNIALNHIEKLEHGTFTGLNNLHKLSVSDNKINNLDEIYSLKYLHELNIFNNHLYQLDVEQITKHLPNLSQIYFNIIGVSCEELMVYLLEFRTKNIEVKKGDLKYQENLNGINCYSISEIKIKKQETDEQKLEYIANYLSGINVALIVILVVLVFVIISTLFSLYQVFVKHRNQTKVNKNLQSCSLKLLSENDSLN